MIGLLAVVVLDMKKRQTIIQSLLDPIPILIRLVRDSFARK